MILGSNLQKIIKGLLVVEIKNAHLNRMDAGLKADGAFQGLVVDDRGFGALLWDFHILRHLVTGRPPRGPFLPADNDLVEI